MRFSKRFGWRDLRLLLKRANNEESIEFERENKNIFKISEVGEWIRFNDFHSISIHMSGIFSKIECKMWFVYDSDLRFVRSLKGLPERNFIWFAPNCWRSYFGWNKKTYHGEKMIQTCEGFKNIRRKRGNTVVIEQM